MRFEGIPAKRIAHFDSRLKHVKHVNLFEVVQDSSCYQYDQVGRYIKLQRYVLLMYLYYLVFDTDFPA